MQYVSRTKHGFVIRESMEGAILELVRSDQGDGGWSLHSIRGGSSKDYLLKGDAKEWGSGWTRPDNQDIRAALALEFVERVSLAASVGDFTDDWGQEAYALAHDSKHSKVRY